MSLTVVNGTPSEILPGTAVRMSTPNYVWTGVVTALRPRGRAEVVITSPGDSIHCPGQLVVVATRLLTPLRGSEAERHHALARQLAATPPAARRAERPGPDEALIEAIRARGEAMTRDIDDAVWYLGQRMTEAADVITSAIELAAAPLPRRRWRRRL